MDTRGHAGRDPAALGWRAVMFTAVSDDRDSARRAARAALCSLFAPLPHPYYEYTMQEQGYGALVAGLRERVPAGRLDQAIDSIPDALVDSLVIAGTPAECRARIASYAGLLDEILLVNLVTLVVNALLAALFIFGFGWGVPGAAWATNCATATGLVIALTLFVRASEFSAYRAMLTWRLNLASLLAQFRLGLPMGVMLAADLFGFALFQLMQVKLGAVDGAASQVVMMLTSLAYMPAIGIALAGTTLVGQSIGAGDKIWARHLGNAVIAMAMIYMGSVGLLLGLIGGWTVGLFVTPDDPLGPAVVATGMTLMWLAGAYQLFDGMTLGASFCLRGAGDASVPAVLVLGMSWLFFVPLAHSLAFAPGQSWVDWLPQFGLGAAGGWLAAVIYVCLIGITMLLRWRSRAWERITVR